jgi:hypothetical protein
VCQYIDTAQKRCTRSMRVQYFFKKLPSFGPYRPEKEISYFTKKLQVQISNMTRSSWSQTTILNDRHLAEPLPFHCTLPLNVHMIEIFVGFDFEICNISLLVMSKYKIFEKNFFDWSSIGEVRFFLIVLRLRGMKNNFELGQKNIFCFFHF